MINISLQDNYKDNYKTNDNYKDNYKTNDKNILSFIFIVITYSVNYPMVLNFSLNSIHAITITKNQAWKSHSIELIEPRNDVSENIWWRIQHKHISDDQNQ